MRNKITKRNEKDAERVGKIFTVAFFMIFVNATAKRKSRRNGKKKGNTQTCKFSFSLCKRRKLEWSKQEVK